MIAVEVILALYFDLTYVSNSSVVSTCNVEMYVGCLIFDSKGIRIFVMLAQVRLL